MMNYEIISSIVTRTEESFIKLLGKTMLESGSSIFAMPEEVMPYIADLLKYWRETKGDLLKYAEEIDEEKIDAEKRHIEEMNRLREELREQRKLLNSILQKVEELE